VIKQLQDAWEKVPKEDLPRHFNSIVESVQKMKNFLAVSAHFLNSYDLQQAQLTIDQLERDISKARSDLIPKKFTFSHKSTNFLQPSTPALAQPQQQQQQQPPPPPPQQPQPQQQQQPPPQQQQPPPPPPPPQQQQQQQQQPPPPPPPQQQQQQQQQQQTDDSQIFKNLDHINLIVPQQLSEESDITFQNVKHSKVFALFVTRALRILDAEESIFYLGPVTGSLFIARCNNSVFYAACQQIRIHATTCSDFYLYVQSRPTIENCNRLRFAPYAFTYPNYEEYFRKCGFDIEANSSKNKWSEVQDFDWPARPNSPHWSVIPERERISFAYQKQQDQDQDQNICSQKHLDSDSSV